MLWEGADLGVHGLGRERTLQDYATFSGIVYPIRSLSATAYAGTWAKPVPQPVGALQCPSPE